MALYAIGDVQGCDQALAALLERLDFSTGRDRLWFVGDLVNRGPDSLGVLRRVHALGESAVVVLGNHDLHCLAVAFGQAHERPGDTLSALLEAPDRRTLLDWLLARPLIHPDPALGWVLLHAGLAPQWTIPTAIGCAREVEQALQRTPERTLAGMYGDGPDRWDERLEGTARARFIVNCLTRLRVVDAEGRLVLRAKDAPERSRRRGWIPWFEFPARAWRGSRIVFGHWSTLGFHRNADVVGLDTGCVWGGRLSALRLDVDGAEPVSVACPQAAQFD